jgi:hypothetical protein
MLYLLCIFSRAVPIFLVHRAYFPTLLAQIQSSDHWF